MASLHALPRWMLIGLIGVALYVGLCLGLFLLQRSLIYHPQPRTAPAVQGKSLDSELPAA